MAFLPIQGVWIPAPPGNQTTPVFASSVIDATGEKLAFIGRVWNKDRATKSIVKVGFQFGSVTKAGGSALTVSLQDVDVVNGPPFRPDGTQDQTVAVANADAGFTSNSWYQTAALSASRSVAFGELLSVVIEYDGGGRLGADAVNINSLNLASGTITWLTSGVSLLASGSWGAVQALPNVILEFTDGTFGTFDYGWPVTAMGSVDYDNASVADEIALEFTVPVQCKCDGAYMFVSVNAGGSNFDIVLYEGTNSIIATVSHDANAVHSVGAGVGKYVAVPFPEVTLRPSSIYRLALKPTTTGNINLFYFDVNDANHFQAHAGGTSWVYNTRADAGSWGTATTTRRPWAGIKISALEHGVQPTYGLGI